MEAVMAVYNIIADLAAAEKPGVKDLLDAGALQQIADSYLSWKKLNGFHARVSEPAMESPSRFDVNVWHDYAPNEMRASGYLDKRELAMLRGPQEVVRCVYGMVEGRVYECRDILEQIKSRNGGYGDFAFDFLTGTGDGGVDARAIQTLQQIGLYNMSAGAMPDPSGPVKWTTADQVTVENVRRQEIERQRTAWEIPYYFPFPTAPPAPVQPASTPFNKPKPKPPGHSELTRELDID
jgi:hypothetical protein